jgi:hypothetical protein
MEAAETSRRSLGELFVERGLISQSDLDLALEEQAATNRRLADILVRRGLVSGHDITSALMEQLGSAAPAVSQAPESTAEVIALPQPAPASEPETEPAPAAAVDEVELAPAPEPEPTPPHGMPGSARDLIAEADARCRGAEGDLSAARESQARVLRELEQVHAQLEARQAELTKQFANWQEAKDEAERWGSRLDEFQTRLEQTDQELADASETAAAWAARATELGSNAEALAGTVESALHELDTLLTTRFPADDTDLPDEADPVDDQSRAHSLYVVPNAEGYDLIERDGEAPDVGETLEFGDQQYVVTKIGPSPLPYDRRTCIFLAVV